LSIVKKKKKRKTPGKERRSPIYTLMNGDGKWEERLRDLVKKT